MGSFRYNFTEKSKERLLSQKSTYPDFGFGSMEHLEERGGCSCAMGEPIKKYWRHFQEFVVKAFQLGRADPRKFIFSAKMGLALVIISLLIFLQPFADLARYSVWALLTVVVVFEFSIGATLSKGFNRALGTLSAGGLALATAELCNLAGELEETVIVITIFIVGFVATYIKLYPTMKAYEYGFRVFLLTYCYVMVSGYRTREFVSTAVNRFVLIALGAGVSLGVNIFIYPIWAGEDLHDLVIKNFTAVAASLEGCVNGYLQCVEYERVPSKILTYQASADDPVYSGYRSAVESTSQEESLLSFSIWEPPHGPYKKFRYPWKNYVKVSGALRHCAFSVMAMHGCILSEIQAPAERRRVFSDELQQVSVEGAKVLREIGNKVKKMEKLDAGDILLKVHEAAEELQTKIDKRSYLLVNAELWEIGTRTKVLENPQDLMNLVETETKVRVNKSLSETVLDLSSLQLSRSWDVQAPITEGYSLLRDNARPESILKKQKSWHSHLSIDNNRVVEEQSKTYESASALSLATFTSLLIEFVARLQNVVHAFEELGEVANFKEPVTDKTAEGEKIGFWRRLCRGFCLKN